MDFLVIKGWPTCAFLYTQQHFQQFFAQQHLGYRISGQFQRIQRNSKAFSVSKEFFGDTFLTGCYPWRTFYEID